MKRSKLFLLCGMLLAGGAGSAFGHGDLHDRITNLTAQIKVTPAPAALYLERGELHRVHREFTNAFADFDRAQRLDPKLLMVDYCRGRTLMEAGEFEAALVPLTRYLSKTTNDANAFATRGRVRAELKDSRAAAADFTRAIALAPMGTPEFYIERAETLRASGSKEEALRGIDEGVARMGPLITLQLQAIDIEVALKRFDSALKRLDGVLSRTPRKESWLVRRAEILKIAGRNEASQSAYREALAALDKLPTGQRHTRAMTQLEASIRSALREEPNRSSAAK
ncbi:MAG TPA: tetratricopeptide repeat protein [Candidatus Acidoferrum sp.]|nr:tetratricopeptide repeat protein [Candidatus Acidoferrum sp.]